MALYFLPASFEMQAMVKAWGLIKRWEMGNKRSPGEGKNKGLHSKVEGSPVLSG